MPDAQTLVIQHVPDSGPPQFRVVRGSDLKAADPAEIRPPHTWPVAGRPDSHLARELRWYLEWFLDYPFPPETDHAERVLASLQSWGREAFQALFNNRQAGGFFNDATAQGAQQLLLQISSDDPHVLAWPWEALEDPAGGAVAQQCRIERRLNSQRDPLPLSPDLPRDRIQILLVTARPYEADVGYRSISRPLVELIHTEQLPAHVTLLRPPTFDQLRDHLRERPNRYHIVHFDGHGAYGDLDSSGGGVAGDAAQSPYMLKGPQGHLLFETADGQPDPQPASTVSELLQEHNIPAVVLNACQSATIDERAADAFASVAGALLKARVRSVTAMAWSLYVSAAQQFLPEFYRRLFATGEFSEAVRAGRQQLLARYHQLGMIAQKQRQFDDAEQWYRKSLEIEERLGNEWGAASSYGQLGNLCGLRGQFVQSSEWLIKAALSFRRLNAPHDYERQARNFVIFLNGASPDDQAAMRARWIDAGLPELPPGES